MYEKILESIIDDLIKNNKETLEKYNELLKDYVNLLNENEMLKDKLKRD